VDQLRLNNQSPADLWRSALQSFDKTRAMGTLASKAEIGGV